MGKDEFSQTELLKHLITYKAECAECHKNALETNLELRHIDHNKENDSYKNIEILCESCHITHDNSHKIKNSKENQLNMIVNINDLNQVILTLFKENPDKYYTPRLMHEIIQKKDRKYYADTLWGLWKKGFLVHPQRGYYQWNGNKSVYFE